MTVERSIQSLIGRTFEVGTGEDTITIDLENASTLIKAKDFDLHAFFAFDEEEDDFVSKSDSHIDDQNEEPKVPDLLVTLRNDANESIGTLTKKITSESFAAGASMTSSVFSALSSLVGSCGVFCAHSLSALSQAGNLSSVSGLAGGLNSPSFSVDGNGNFHLDSNMNVLSKVTGIRNGNLLSGNFSTDRLLMNFSTMFGEGVHLFCGFGLIEVLFGALFNSTHITGSDSGEIPMAA